SDRYETGLALAEALDRYLRSLLYDEVLPVPLREHAKSIAPPTDDTEGYGLSSAPTAAVTASRTGTTESPAELGERIEAFLAAGKATEALLACQSAGDTFARSTAGGNLIRQAFTNAINGKLQARDLKQAMRFASALHSSVLPLESADLLAKTLS